MAQKMDLLLDSESALSRFARLLARYTRASTMLHCLTPASVGLLRISTPSLISDGKLIRHPLTLALEIVRKSETEVLLGETKVHNAQVSAWVELANSVKRETLLKYLDDALVSRTFLVSNHITVADLAAYSAVFSFLSHDATDEDKQAVINVMRWVRHLQSLPGFVEAVGGAVEFLPAAPQPAAEKKEEEKKLHTEEKAEKSEENKAEVETEKPKEVHRKAKEEHKIPSEEHKKLAEERKKAAKEAKKQAGDSEGQPKGGKKQADNSGGQPKGGKKPAAAEPAGDPASLLDMRVGRIVKIWRHPTREHIFCEDVDMGNGEMRTIASGLVGYVTEEQMTNSLVVILANLKPRKMDDFMSQGMVLCASFNEGIEPLRPPVDSQPGDRIIVEGLPSAPLAELPPKKQYWEAAMKELRVDAEGRATYKSQPLVTPRGIIVSPTFKAGTIS